MSASAEKPGRLIVVSGPSGSGKSTLLRRVLARPEVRARLSVSATTRPPRPGEQDGREYLFVTPEAFAQARERGEFLEWAEVHGHLYGTPLGPVLETLRAGVCVILEIDVQGAMLVRQRVPDALLIFLNVPDVETLEARLRARATDDEATIQRRLANARAELAQAPRYDCQIVNDQLDQAVAELIAVLQAHGCAERA